MIEINLIPDIKAEFLRAQATKRIVVTISMLVSAVFVAAAVLLWVYVSGVQGGQINNNDERIKELYGNYTSLDDISKVLTVEGQLISLPNLHDELPEATRLPAYFTKLVPNTVKFNNVQVLFNDNRMSMEGTTKDVRTVNQFIDTLKNAVYAVQGGNEVLRVFNLVILEDISTVSEENDTDDDKSNNTQFQIRVEFDPTIFDATKNVVLAVPSTTSDDAELLQPEDLVSLDELIDTAPREDDLFEEPATEGEVDGN